MPTDLTELSKRELFAALIAAGFACSFPEATAPTADDLRGKMARASVDLADELIKELAQ